MANMSPTKVPMPQQDPDIRNKNFDEVATGYTMEVAIEEAQKLVLNGNRIPLDLVCGETNLKNMQKVRLYDFSQKFIGIYSYIEENKEYKPVKLFFD